jgi:hypothetical protein
MFIALFIPPIDRRAAAAAAARAHINYSGALACSALDLSLQRLFTWLAQLLCTLFIFGEQNIIAFVGFKIKHGCRILFFFIFVSL